MRARALASSLLSTLLAASCLLPIAARADDWPQWRGPHGDGTSAATQLPATWSKTENLHWRVPLPGPGPSTPIVIGSRILLTAGDGEQIHLLALGRGGKELWRRPLDAKDYDARSGESNAAAPSPASDGDSVFTFTGTGKLARHGLDGTAHWSKDLSGGAGRFDMYFGMSSTPLLDAGTLYVPLLHGNGQHVVAIDAATGEERWRIERPTDARAECLHAYTSPVLFGRGDGAQLIVHGADYTTAHAPRTGKELWRFSGFHGDQYNPSLRLVASPVVAGDLLVIPTAKNGPVFGLEPRKASGEIKPDAAAVRWQLARNTTDVPSPVVAGGIVYVVRENGFLIALDAQTGDELYAERVHGAPHRSSPVVADGKLFMVGMDGMVSVIKTGRAYELLAQNAMDERTAASPVIVDRTLYLRTYAALYAIGVPEKEPAGAP